MAPSSRNDHSENAKLRDEIFCDVAFKSEVPADYISLKKAERDYGVHLQVCNTIIKFNRFIIKTSWAEQSHTQELFCQTTFSIKQSLGQPKFEIETKKHYLSYLYSVFCLKDFKKFGVPLDGLGAVRGKQNGHLGIYFEQDYLENVRYA